MRILFTFLICACMVLASNAQQSEPSNKHFSHTLETSSNPEVIWAIWTDVPNWKDWDTGLKDAILDGELDMDSKGKIVSLEGRTSKFKVVAFEKDKSYTFKTNLPFGGLYVKRTLEKKAGKTFFTHEVWFKGLLAGVFAKRFGPEFREMLPGVMRNIKEIAEK